MSEVSLCHRSPLELYQERVDPSARSADPGVRQFSNRLWSQKRRLGGEVPDDVVLDCLLMAKDEYVAKYQRRTTIIEVDGKQVDLQEVWRQFEECAVVGYSQWRQRVKTRLGERPFAELCQLAATSDKDGWWMLFGGGRKITATFQGVEYPRLKGLHDAHGADHVSYGTFKIRYRKYAKLFGGEPPEDAILDALTAPTANGEGGSLYLIINKVNGKRYVGITQQSVDRRWYYHVGAAKRGLGGPESLQEAVRQHGADAFEIVELARLPSMDALVQAEADAILEHGTAAPAGYNVAAAGSIGRHFGTQVRWRGVDYRTIDACAEALAEETGLPHYILQTRLRDHLAGKLPEDDVLAPARSVSDHPMRGTRTFRIWQHMLKRATQAGVAVHPPWRDFQTWFDEQGLKFVESTEMAWCRRDQRGPFLPENCFWGTKADRQKRSPNTIRGIIEGTEYNLSEACAHFAVVNMTTARHRMKSLGWSFETAVKTPAEGSRKPKASYRWLPKPEQVFRSMTAVAGAIAEKEGVPRERIRDQIRRGKRSDVEVLDHGDQ